MNVDEMSNEELKEFWKIYQDRRKGIEEGTYFCEGDNFDPETFKLRYGLLQYKMKDRGLE